MELNKLTLRTILRLFQVLVMAVLFYGCETWKTNYCDNKKCLRRIPKVRWPYIISNNDILRITKMKTISDEVKERRWKWIGLVRKDDSCHCKTARTWHAWAPEGRRKVGRSKNNVEANSGKRKKCIWGPGGGGNSVERWVRGCAAQIGCIFSPTCFSMTPVYFKTRF